jgi:mono/diheme cytochrome c family protein/uncharacterized membrane protein
MFVGGLAATIGIDRAAASAAKEDLASQVLSVFSAKCAGCHGPNLAKPRGRFGYVLDLARVAGNPEMVIPSSADESELWELVRRGEMPPEESPTGPLTDAEKETIRAWIAAGAPTKAASPPPSNSDASPVSVSAPAGWKSILYILGPFHVLAVHFPIALLIVAAVAELWDAFIGGREMANAVRLCVFVGAASAVATAALGWIHASNGHGAGSRQILAVHRWIGTAAASWAVATAIFSEWNTRRGERRGWFRAWLLVGAVLIAIEGHVGGMLVHGDDFLSGG